MSAKKANTKGQEQDEPSKVRDAFAEFLGTALLAFLGTGIISISGHIAAEAIDCKRVVLVALVDGFAFYTLVYLAMRMTNSQSAYLNPSLTLSLAALDSYMSPKYRGEHITRALSAMISQFLGALVGTAFILISMPDPLNGSEKLGFSQPRLGTTHGQAFLLEVLAGFFLATCVMTVRKLEERRSSLLIAFAYITIRMLAFPLSGGFANPARSFGAAVLGGGRIELLMYLIASPIGSLLGTWSFIYLNQGAIDIDARLIDSDDL